MEKFIVLLCLVWFVAGGVIVNRSQQDSQSVQGVQNGGEEQIHTLTRDILLRQKFILDILQQVESPLQNQQLLDLNTDGGLQENMYIGALDDNTRLLQDLKRTNSVKGRNNLFSMNNEDDMRQMASLYLLLVRSRDFKAFQRTAVHARVHVNPVLFVNALILAIEDRTDTQMLISPALYEILPKLYQDDSLVRQVEMMNLHLITNDGNSIRPNILDVISLGRQTKELKMRSSQGEDGRDTLNRAQLWTPWRNMRRQLAIQKSLNGKDTRDNIRQDAILLTSSKKDGLIADDIGLRSFLNILIGELILEQSVLRNTLNANADNILNLPESRINIIKNRVSEIHTNNNEHNRILGNNLNNAETRVNIISERLGLRESDNSLGGNARLHDRILGNNLNNAATRANLISESQGLRESDNNFGGNARLQDRILGNNLNNAATRANIISERQALRESGNKLGENVRGFSDESDWLNAHRDVNDNVRDALPNRRLLHVQLQDLLQLRGNQLNNDFDNSMLQRDRSQVSNSHVNEQKNLIDMVVRANGQHQQNMIPQRGDDVTRNSGIRISSAQLLLHQLQQLVARLNIEDITLRRSSNILNMEGKNVQQSNRISDSSIDIHLDDSQRRTVVTKMNEISERLNGSLEKIMLQMSNAGQINALGSRLPGQIDHIVLIEILNEVTSLCEYVPDGQVSSILENSTTQLLMRHIVNTIERQLQKLRRVRNNIDIAFNGVKINNADIDKLHTYLEYSNVDLSNMLLSNTGGDAENSQLVIGRIPRLNHKPFVIKLDVNSDHDQRVVVRTLLVPKEDTMGNLLSPMQQRQNVVLLDITNVNLKSGRNLIMRQSQDITWTGRDSTMYTEIYKRVMSALQNGLELTNDIPVGQNNLLPHRLLIPRGRTSGLQMQLLIVITPAEENADVIPSDRKGLDSIVLDNLPLTFPLDRDLKDLNTITSLPNVHTNDILIYHDNQLKMPLQ